jgi:hypothetical protein
VIVAVAYHAVAGHDHLTKEVILADDVDVVVRVGGGRNKREEITEILGTSDFVELTTIFQAGGREAAQDIQKLCGLPISLFESTSSATRLKRIWCAGA